MKPLLIIESLQAHVDGDLYAPLTKVQALAAIELIEKLLAVVEAAEEIRKCEETDGYGHVGIPDLIEKLKALREEENGTMGFPGSPQGDESWKAKVAEPPAKYRGFGGGIDPREKEQKG